ncbi:hypothetical protein Chro_0031 [Chroococcidiopsis thermalis PCC 7203]|jgi:hypothetical protein|uniref:Uncharacterized protein n=1 Tax=Chroococcidiopsis thermalis (strain PCC 7203) TaxID=251229 RepID=K9TT54_CHRTP|nr:hypothetical protein Chro_0031 [Chroococcidiopsis thermalis PCC 7203]
MPTLQLKPNIRETSRERSLLFKRISFDRHAQLPFTKFLLRYAKLVISAK